MVTEATQNAQAAPGRAIPSGCDVHTRRTAQRMTRLTGTPGDMRTDQDHPAARQQTPATLTRESLGEIPGLFFGAMKIKAVKER